MHVVKQVVQQNSGSGRSFLVQSFKETLQYCDEWRKFTSVSQTVSQSVSHSVNFPGGGVNFDHVA